jgi:hypothetical protein
MYLFMPFGHHTHLGVGQNNVSCATCSDGASLVRLSKDTSHVYKTVQVHTVQLLKLLP